MPHALVKWGQESQAKDLERVLDGALVQGSVMVSGWALEPVLAMGRPWCLIATVGKGVGSRVELGVVATVGKGVGSRVGLGVGATVGNGVGLDMRLGVAATVGNGLDESVVGA